MAPPNNHEKALFNMCTDTISIYKIYEVSIPLSRICFFTSVKSTSSLWKMPAAKADAALTFSKTSEKCSTLPASPEAITGIISLFLMWLVSSISKSLLLPFLSMQLRRISPAPSFSYTWADCNCIHIPAIPIALYGALIPGGYWLSSISYHYSIWC